MMLNGVGMGTSRASVVILGWRRFVDSYAYSTWKGPMTCISGRRREALLSLVILFSLGTLR